MNVQQYHLSTGINFSFKELIDGISKIIGENFIRVFSEAGELVNEKLQNFKTTVPLSKFIKDFEIFVSRDLNHALFIALEIGFIQLQTVEFLEIYENENRVDIISLIRKKFYLKKFSERGKNIINFLEKNLGKLSPNGKFLANSNFIKKIQPLLSISDLERSKLKKIISVFNDDVIPINAISDLLKEDYVKVEEFCNNSGFFEILYAIICKKCDTSLLTSTEKEKANSILNDSNNYCTLCKNKGTLKIVEQYRINEEIRLGIQQGLWLELLVKEIISEYCNLFWIGRMFETNELDAVFFAFDRLFLIECKDTSFGQNDFYSLAGKAEALHAIHIFIITTHEIHPNVKKIVDKRKNFKIICHHESDKIKDELRGIFAYLQENYPQMWLRYFVHQLRNF